MTLVILEVVGDPVLAFRSVGPAGEPLLARVFSGQCLVGHDPHEKTLARLSVSRTPVRLGCYVPDAGPFRPSYQLSSWVEVFLAAARISAGGHTKPGPYGADAAAIEMVDDGRGSGSQWPFLWFTAHGGEPMTVRYRMTVTEPAD